MKRTPSGFWPQWRPSRSPRAAPAPMTMPRAAAPRPVRRRHPHEQWRGRAGRYEHGARRNRHRHHCRYHGNGHGQALARPFRRGGRIPTGSGRRCFSGRRLRPEPEQSPHLDVFHLGKVVVPVAHRAKPARGVEAERQLSACSSSARQVSLGATGTATSTRDGAETRTAPMAASMVDPVANPSPAPRCAPRARPPDAPRGRPAPAGAARPLHQRRIREHAGGDREGLHHLVAHHADTAGRDRAHRELLMAGHTQLAYHQASSGASRARATSQPTGTPPRGNASTTGRRCRGAPCLREAATGFMAITEGWQ